MSEEPPEPHEFIPIPDEHYAAIGRVTDAWADWWSRRGRRITRPGK